MSLKDALTEAFQGLKNSSPFWNNMSSNTSGRYPLGQYTEGPRPLGSQQGNATRDYLTNQYFDRFSNVTPPAMTFQNSELQGPGNDIINALEQDQQFNIDQRNKALEMLGGSLTNLSGGR